MKHTQFRRMLSLFCIASLLLALGACGGKWKDDKPYAGYDMEEYITLGEYKGVEAQFLSEEKYLELYMKSVFEEYSAPMGIADDPGKAVIAEGDLVYFDFAGTAENVSEVTKEGMTGKTLLVIGSGKFIPGFEEKMVGQPRGKEFEVKVTFPAAYGAEGSTQAELNGKDATFKCTVHAIGVETEEITDEGVIGLTGGQYATAKEFQELLQEQMAAELPLAERLLQKNADIAFGAAFEKAEILKLPEREQKYWDDQLAEDATRQGLGGPQEYAQMYGYESAEAFRDEQIGHELFVFAIAQKEGLEVTDKDTQALLNDIRASNGDTGSDAEIYSKYGGKGRMLRHLAQNKVAEFLYENAKDSPAAAE